MADEQEKVDVKAQAKVEVELLVDSIQIVGGFIHKAETPKVKIAKWQADIMVSHKLVTIVGAK